MLKGVHEQHYITQVIILLSNTNTGGSKIVQRDQRSSLLQKNEAFSLSVGRPKGGAHTARPTVEYMTGHIGIDVIVLRVRVFEYKKYQEYMTEERYCPLA